MVDEIIKTILSLLSIKVENYSEIEQKNHEFKRKYLDEAYRELISVINLYPTVSPNDIMKCIDYPPIFFRESYDSVLNTLDYQIADYRNQLKNKSISLAKKNDIDVYISNRIYVKDKIKHNRVNYFNAENNYNEFYKSKKEIIDLYAGQNVKNCLVSFRVAIENIFYCGFYSEVGDKNHNNIIENNKRLLIESIRSDLGIF